MDSGVQKYLYCEMAEKTKEGIKASNNCLRNAAESLFWKIDIDNSGEIDQREVQIFAAIDSIG